MTTLENLETIYENYLRDMALRREADSGISAITGALLTGYHGQDAINQRFATDVENVFQALSPQSEDLRAVTAYIYDRGVEFKSDVTFGMMFTAMYQFLTPFVSRETPEYRRELATRFDGDFPPRLRTPVMVKFRKALYDTGRRSKGKERI